LNFYGYDRLGSVLGSELQALQAYDRLLESESKRHADFASAVNSREQIAVQIVRSHVEHSGSWGSRLLRRLVSRGDGEAIQELAMQPGNPVLQALKASLTDGSRDLYEAWLKVGDTPLDFTELSAVATRLSSRATADLAAKALIEAASRFPIEARSLDEVARLIASELGDPNVYQAFRKATVTK